MNIQQNLGYSEETTRLILDKLNEDEQKRFRI